MDTLSLPRLRDPVNRAVYELFEWIFAVSSDPTAGIAVLGSQGDIWDAQQDMLADGLGAIFAAVLFYFMNRKEISEKIKP